MKKISTETVNQLIEQAVKQGKSSQIAVEDSAMPYFRMLVSRYNKLNKTKISVRGVHGVYREICAPFDRFFDNDEWKSAFDLIQNVLSDDDFTLTENQLLMIKEKMHGIVEKCSKQTVINGVSPMQKGLITNDLLK